MPEGLSGLAIYVEHRSLTSLFSASRRFRFRANALMSRIAAFGSARSGGLKLNPSVGVGGAKGKKSRLGIGPERGFRYAMSLSGSQEENSGSEDSIRTPFTGRGLRELMQADKVEVCHCKHCNPGACRGRHPCWLRRPKRQR